MHHTWEKGDACFVDGELPHALRWYAHALGELRHHR
jgi:hypothetical protein